MNTILLQPTDVLFFRDGRPMEGSLSGHGTAWPLPTVISSAFHAALHRADIEKATGQRTHSHRRGRSGAYGTERDRKFGSLCTVGPFPVRAHGELLTWFYPHPADAQLPESTETSFLPVRVDRGMEPSSLPSELLYPAANTLKPSKNKPGTWWSEAAWNAYLGTPRRSSDASSERDFFKSEWEFADHEHSIGIGIDLKTGTQDGQRFYSASYLRLREGWRLGAFATAPDKDFQDSGHSSDLISVLLNREGAIMIGGQQRACSAWRVEHSEKRLPLPLGRSEGFLAPRGKHLVKWVLLSPAIWPELPAGKSSRRTQTVFHPGGWLPSWISPGSGQVLLRTVTRDERSRRRSLNYDGKGYRSDENTTAINARLVAAIVPKPSVVTGWGLAHETGRAQPGAKSTHLAVPAGAVYYFEADSDPDARLLAEALNWHGASLGTEIKNRRSTLFGEKGFGLGVCGTWNFSEEVGGRPAKDNESTTDPR